ncbi:MAG: polyprenyl synthetase family protein [Acidobacteriota bacterium]|nr:polyprenyl synthetase family protein [Acidobacteriota bacterium]
MTDLPQEALVHTEDEAGRQAQFLALVADKLAATEIELRQYLASDVPFIDQACDYMATSGGKRVRPALLLLTSQMLGHDGEEEITYAAVIELIHTASLIHDDIIDHATLRRGADSVNHLWGNSRTVLLGDWMYTTAMNMALSHGNLEVIRRLCVATLKMIEGELLTLERLGSVDLTTEEYFQIIERKTAHLFAAACEIPTLIAPTVAGSEAVLSSYGHQLGICFQLVDDLLDFTATEDELGKPVLSDLREGKLTLPLILVLGRSGSREKDLVRSVLEDRSFDRVAPEQILELVESAGTLQEVEEMARCRASEAQQVLELFPDVPARSALEYTPEFILRRRA